MSYAAFVLDEASFIEAMADAPDDPAPRIVFADWLLEREDPRGEFFRLHHEITYGKPSKVAEKRYARVALRELRRVLPRAPESVEFRRAGRLLRVEVTLAELFASASRLFSLGPIQTLRITRLDGSIDALARFEPLRWVFELDLSRTSLNAEAAATLAASPHLHRLRALAIDDLPLGPGGIAGFAALPALAVLRASRTALAGDAACLLPAMPRLRALDLVHCDLDGDGLATLLAAARVLRYLDISSNPLGARGSRAIALASHLAHLTKLALDHCVLDDDALAALAGAAHLDELRSLSLRGNAFGTRGAEALAASPNLRSLQQVRLDDNPQISWELRSAIERRFRR